MNVNSFLLSCSATVLMWNIFWLINYGWKEYKEMYNGKISVNFSIFVWLYLLCGIITTLIAIL